MLDSMVYQRMGKLNIPFGTLHISNKSFKLISDVMKSKRLSCGKYVRDFEKRFASLLKVEKATAVSSGTDALTLALATLYDRGARRGQEVICPALTFVASANAILAAGFLPRFVDVDKETLCLTTRSVMDAINDNTIAILAVHLMGKPAPIKQLVHIAQESNVYLIEDAAEAHGGKYDGKYLGSFGDMGCFSLYVAHIISSIEGGMVVTNNTRYADVLRSLRSHGRACKCEVCQLNTKSGYCSKRFSGDEDIRFKFERVGFSSKMNEIEAIIGLGNIDKFDEIVSARRNNLKKLTKGIEDLNKYIYTIHASKGEVIGPHAFPMILTKKAPFSRNDFINHLASRGIDTRNLFSSIPTQCGGWEFLGHKIGDFPNAEYIGNNGLHIGVHQDIKQNHINYILKTIHNFVKSSEQLCP